MRVDGPYFYSATACGAFLYSRRGLLLRGRGAYGPVPRVVAADAAGAEALVGVLKIIKDASYNKTREPPWRAGKRGTPFGGLRHHLSPR